MISSRIFQIAVVFFAVAGSISFADDSDCSTAYKFRETLLNGHDVSARICLAVYDPEDFKRIEIKNRSGSYAGLWGAGGTDRDPENVISDFAVYLDGIRETVSYSAFSDLANIRAIDLKVEPGGFYFEIEGYGGDSERYFATISFHDYGYIKSRRVWAPTFPDEVWEETIYSYIDPFSER